MASMITTEDNPYDPRTDFEAWYMWDVGQGYNTSSYLDRVAGLPDELPEAVIDRMRDDAIDAIIAIHSGGMYKKLLVDETVASDPIPEATSAA